MDYFINHRAIRANHPAVFGNHPAILSCHKPFLRDHKPFLTSHGVKLYNHVVLIGVHGSIIGDHVAIIVANRSKRVVHEPKIVCQCLHLQCRYKRLPAYPSSPLALRRGAEGLTRRICDALPLSTCREGITAALLTLGVSHLKMPQISFAQLPIVANKQLPLVA